MEDQAVVVDESPLVNISRIVKMDEQTRQITHVISTAKLDRGNRYIDQAGWSLTDYRANPVVLANHDYSVQSIIGKGIDVKVVRDELTATTEFDTEGLGALAFRLVQAGLAKAWSVGWKGIKSHRFGENQDCAVCKDLMKTAEYGLHFTRQTLLEYSLVAIPSNPNAVIGLHAAGYDVSDAEAELLLQFDINSNALPPQEAAPNGAKADEKIEDGQEEENVIEVPSRSAEFYDMLFKTARRLGRRNHALEASKRFRKDLRS